MSGRTVSTLTNVKDVNKLADHAANENDIITDEQGNVYLKHGSNSYLKLSLSGDNDSLKTDIKNLKSENTKLKNRVTELETAKGEQDTKIESLETSNTDLITRVEALENPDTTT